MGLVSSTVETKTIVTTMVNPQKPDFDTLHTLGIAAWKNGELDTALNYLQQAISIRPQSIQAQYNCGVVLQQLLRLDEAFACYKRVIAHPSQFPNSYKAHMNQSLILLMQGQLLEGWKKYEWRWHQSAVSMNQEKRQFVQPLWLGQTALAGKAILLHHEQGLGDTLQFCRYIPQVVALGARVVVEAPAALLPLLSTIPHAENITWVALGDALPAFDMHCPFMSLALAFQTELATIPAPIPYLQAEANRVAHWEKRLGKKTRPRIGLVWSGGADHHNDHNRSLSLRDLIRHLPPNRDYVCLQKEIRSADLPLLSAPSSQKHIRNFAKDIRDFADTAALCELMDGVISVDTSVAHLAGALGKPLWMLLPFTPDWRWMQTRADSPWYPSATLYRQPTRGDWDSVLQKIATDLNTHYPGTASASPLASILRWVENRL